MSREARKRSECGIYHVMFRGNNQQVIFEDDYDRTKFLSLLRECQEQSGKKCFIIYSYCLMSNHVHLLYREMDEGVELSMKRIGTAYAQYFNTKYGRVGHLFQDRYRSEPCDNMDYFVTLIRYIHQNPVKAHVSSSIEDYQWSSWHEYEHLDGGDICDVDAVMKRLSFDELSDMVHSLLPEETNCMDVKPDCYVRKSDDYAAMMVKELFPNVNIAAVERSERKRIVLILKDYCLACDQVARATGLSYQQVYRIYQGKK